MCVWQNPYVRGWLLFYKNIEDWYRNPKLGALIETIVAFIIAMRDIGTATVLILRNRLIVMVTTGLPELFWAWLQKKTIVRNFTFIYPGPSTFLEDMQWSIHLKRKSITFTDQTSLFRDGTQCWSSLLHCAMTHFRSISWWKLWADVNFQSHIVEKTYRKAISTQHVI